MRMTMIALAGVLVMPAQGFAQPYSGPQSGIVQVQSLERGDMWRYDLERERESPRFRRLYPDERREVLRLDGAIHEARERHEERRLHELWERRQRILERGERRP